MKSLLTRIAFAAAMTTVLATGASAEDKVVNIYNWSDYIDPKILEDFTKETGIKVVYDTFDSNEILETKLLAGGTGYDVVVPTANFLARQIQAGVFQKLDKSKLPNISNMWDMVNERVSKYDPGNQYAIDYMWGTNGIGYNKDKVKAITGSDDAPGLDAIFDPKVAAKFKDCGINVLDSPQDVLPAALNYLGLKPDSHDRRIWKRQQRCSKRPARTSASSIPLNISTAWQTAISASPSAIRAICSRQPAAPKRQRTASTSAIRSPSRARRCGLT